MSFESSTAKPPHKNEHLKASSDFLRGNILRDLADRGVMSVLIEGGGHSWGAGVQDQTLPFSFAMVGEMFSQAAAKKQGLGELKDSLGGKADGEDKSKADSDK